MAAKGITFPLFILICFQALNGQAAGTVFVEAECESKIHVEYGQQSILGCNIKTSQEAENKKISFVSWTKNNTLYALFEEGKVKNPLPGHKFAENFWTKDSCNLSLIIDKTAIKDSGQYHFSVITTSGADSKLIDLSVTAKYDKPKIRPKATKNKENAQFTLSCNADGGYPQGRLEWFDEDQKKIVNASKYEASRTEHDLFNLYSEMTLSLESISSKYSCRLCSESGQQVDEEVFYVDNEPELRGQRQENQGRNQELLYAKVAAPLLVIGSLIVGLLLLLLYKRHSHRGDRTDHIQYAAGKLLDVPEQPLPCPA